MRVGVSVCLCAGVCACVRACVRVRACTAPASFHRTDVCLPHAHRAHVTSAERKRRARPLHCRERRRQSFATQSAQLSQSMLERRLPFPVHHPALVIAWDGTSFRLNTGSGRSGRPQLLEPDTERHVPLAPLPASRPGVQHCPIHGPAALVPSALLDDDSCCSKSNINSSSNCSKSKRSSNSSNSNISHISNKY